MNNNANIIVLGAGAVGLSTATSIQSRLPYAKVTIIADRFTVDTTSDGAAGFFRPEPWKTPGVPLDTLRRWCQTSWDYFAKLSNSPEGLEAGCFIISGYRLYNEPHSKVFYEDIVHHVRELTKKELDMFPGKKYKYGFSSTHLLTEPRSYLPYLTRKFQRNGGVIINRHITSFEEFVGKCDVLVNCTGIGSRTLLGDNKLRGCRGQLVKVHAPWIKHFYYTPDGCYILPGKDFVSIGGTLQYDDYSTETRPQESEMIMEKACRILPALKNAPILHSWAGIRPVRHPLRLEAETLSYGNKSLKVVHNYGHGGEGITLSYSTGLDATDLVVKHLHSIETGQPKAKL